VHAGKSERTPLASNPLESADRVLLRAGRHHRPPLNHPGEDLAGTQPAAPSTFHFDLDFDFDQGQAPPAQPAAALSTPRPPPDRALP
jgi:hypothetical protein